VAQYDPVGSPPPPIAAPPGSSNGSLRLQCRRGSRGGRSGRQRPGKQVLRVYSTHVPLPVSGPVTQEHASPTQASQCDQDRSCRSVFSLEARQAAHAANRRRVGFPRSAPALARCRQRRQRMVRCRRRGIWGSSQLERRPLTGGLCLGIHTRAGARSRLAGPPRHQPLRPKPPPARRPTSSQRIGQDSLLQAACRAGRPAPPQQPH